MTDIIFPDNFTEKTSLWSTDKTIVYDPSNPSIPYSMTLDGIKNFVLSTYKINVTVSSNNLTVSLTNNDWSDPSSIKPLYFKIWNTIRKIIVPITNTLNAWTNWFNSWSSMLATLNVDYFVYLSFESTWQVCRLWISRLPTGRVYSDFSPTYTNEKCIAIWWSPSSWDELINIWRFSATLSAWSSYNWSISWTWNAINKPTYETSILSYVPVVTADATAPTFNNNIWYYNISNDMINIMCNITNTTTWWWSSSWGNLYVSTPLTCVTNMLITWNYYADMTSYSTNFVATSNNRLTIVPAIWLYNLEPSHLNYDRRWIYFNWYLPIN